LSISEDKDIVLKKSEKESLRKSFLLFFTTLTILNAFVFYFYLHEQEDKIKEKIFNQMKIYSYEFKDKDITLDVIPIQKKEELYHLKITDNEVYAYFHMPSSTKNTLKLSYPYAKYKHNLLSIQMKSLLYFFLSSLLLAMLAFFYSMYSIKPLKNAFYLLDEFLKDIIHDLNTPISSILLNLKILKHKKSATAINRIEFSVKNLSSLYNNLEMMIKEEPLQIENVDVKSLIETKVKHYKFLYPHLNFKTDIKINSFDTSKNEFTRIIDNLISNACKYNKQSGEVFISIDTNSMQINDSGIGIKNPNKVFNRYYKETDRGIGLGLDIVKKLTKKLGYKINLQSTLNIGTKIEVTFK